MYRVTVPGSIMLLGEHAVVYGRQAMACAINRFVTVILKPRNDDVINITSEFFPAYQTHLRALSVTPPYTFVTSAIISQRKHLPSGFDLTITSTLSPKQGLGSSAAVTVATHQVLADWLGQTIDLKELTRRACTSVREVQGQGSGTDIAASVYGGIIVYRAEPFEVEKINATIPISLVYSGYKTPTSSVIEAVQKRRNRWPDLINAVFDQMDNCVTQGRKALFDHDLKKLGELMNIHQGLQDSLGVNTALLATLIDDLRAHPKIHGAKISGSGLGDCVIGLGNIEVDYFPRSPVQYAQGVCFIPVNVELGGMRRE